jgi:hypothetical protein
VAASPATENVFNGGQTTTREVMEAGVDVGDNKRKQIADRRSQIFVSNISWSLDVLNVFDSVRHATGTNVPDRVINDMVVLYSKEGCCDQPAHTDVEIYSLMSLIKRNGDDGVFHPAGCIADLQPGTYLNVWEGSIDFDNKKPYAHSEFRIELNAGDLLFFRILVPPTSSPTCVFISRGHGQRYFHHGLPHKCWQNTIIVL